MKVSMERRIAITAVSLALLGFTGSVPARADSEVTTTTTETTTMPAQVVTAPGYITIERPVVLQNSEVIKEKEIRYVARAGKSCSHRTAMVKRTPVRKIAARPMLRTNKSFVSEKVIERTIEKPIMIEKPVIVTQTLPPPAIETRTVKVIEQPALIERKVLVQPAVIERKVLVEPAVIETQPLVIMKRRHHLLHVRIPFAGMDIF